MPHHLGYLRTPLPARKYVHSQKGGEVDVPMQFKKQWLQSLPRLLWELKHTHVSVTQVRSAPARSLTFDTIAFSKCFIHFGSSWKHIHVEWIRLFSLVHVLVSCNTCQSPLNNYACNSLMWWLLNVPLYIVVFKVSLAFPFQAVLRMLLYIGRSAPEGSSLADEFSALQPHMIPFFCSFIASTRSEVQGLFHLLFLSISLSS